MAGAGARSAPARAAAVSRLLAARVLTPAEIVDRGVTVHDASRANEVLLVQVEGGGGVAVKTLPAHRCAGELWIHELAAVRPALRRVLPALLAADPAAGWLVLELVTPGDTLTTAHRSAIGYPAGLARAVGRALGTVHRYTSDLGAGSPSHLPWSLFALEPSGPAAFAWEEAPLRSVLEGIDDLERHRRGFAAARSAWQPGCVVHGDFKWDNCLLAAPDGDEATVRIIDWESAGVGDPAWDVAGILQEYLGFVGLLGLEVAGDQRARALEVAAIVPLTDAVRTFFAAYARAAALADAPALAERAVRLAGVRLVQTSLEHASSSGERTPAAAALLDLALAMLEDPGALAVRLRLAATG